MGSESILKSFLVKIGFRLDQQQFRNFQEGMRTTAKNFAELAKGGLAAGTALSATTTVIAKQLESLYFAAQRTGASAAELKEFSFAASQVGVSAESAQAAIEGLAAARRTNPGLNGILAGLGIDPRQTDSAKVMVELLAKLHAMPHYQGAQLASMFGIDEKTLYQLETHGAEFQKYLVLREKMVRAAGINPDDMTAKGHEFMQQLRTLEAGLSNLTEIIAYRLIPTGEKVIGWLEDAVGWLTKADASTGGWSSKILGLVTALGGLKVAASVLGRMFGGAAAGGGAAAAGEGAAAAGSASLGVYGALLGTIVAGAAVTFNQKARDAWTKFASPYAHKAMSKLGISEDQKARWGQKIIDLQDSISGGLTRTATALAGASAKVTAIATSLIGPSSSLAAMISRFEGHAKNGYGVYRDIAGNLTAGIGHLVKKGEDFSHLDRAGALALLAKDIGAALASLMKLVKVHLSQNQRDALTDFEFNIGQSKFSNSTLLKRLNSGDFAGAAAEFERWNKVLLNGHYVTNQGLSNRRAAEAALFRAPDKPVSITQKTDIHVSGGDANRTAREVALQQRRVNGDMVRNFAGAIR